MLVGWGISFLEGSDKGNDAAPQLSRFMLRVLCRKTDMMRRWITHVHWQGCVILPGSATRLSQLQIGYICLGKFARE